MNIAAAMKRKLGPLPAYAWLALFAVAVIGVRKFSGGLGGGPAGSASSQPATLGTGSAFGSFGIGAGADGGGLGSPSDQTPVEPFGAPPVIYDPPTDGYIGTRTANGATPAGATPDTTDSKAPSPGTTTTTEGGRVRVPAKVAGTLPTALRGRTGIPLTVSGTLDTRLPSRPRSSRGQTGTRRPAATTKTTAAPAARPRAKATLPAPATRATGKGTVAVTSRDRAAGSAKKDNDTRTVTTFSAVKVLKASRPRATAPRSPGPTNEPAPARAASSPPPAEQTLALPAPMPASPPALKMPPPAIQPPHTQPKPAPKQARLARPAKVDYKGRH